MRGLKNAVGFAFVYTCGLAFTLLWAYAHVLRLVRIEGEDRIPAWQKSMLIASNHPSLLEPYVLPFLFLREWLFSPIQWGPWATPDKTNLGTLTYWFFKIGGARNIPIVRRQKQGQTKRAFLEEGRETQRRLLEVLKKGGRIVFFPEGGRTWRVDKAKRVTTKSGKELRPIPSSFGTLVQESGAIVLPVWVSYPWVSGHSPRWCPMRIQIGHPLRLSGETSPRAIADRVQAALLTLAEEGDD